MTVTYPTGTGEMESIHVFSDTGVTISSYSGGVLHLSNSECVTFGSGTVAVSPCWPENPGAGCRCTEDISSILALAGS